MTVILLMMRYRFTNWLFTRTITAGPVGRVFLFAPMIFVAASLGLVAFVASKVKR